MIAIPYAPRPLQLRFHEERTRFCVMICHRRFGKTVAAVNDLIRQAIRSGRPDWRAVYAAPYHGQAKAVAWDYLRRYAGAVPGTRFTESELRCDFPDGQRIRLLGTDNAHSLRGLYLDDLVLDEPADMAPEVWTKILRPALADRKGRALFIGTPAGTENLLFAMWERAGGTDAEWSRFRFRASETGYVTPDELAAAARDMSPEEYAQEFECSFAAAIRGAYYAALLDQAEAEGRITELAHDPALPVHTAWDLGMDDATAIWFFQVDGSGSWRVIDYYENSGEGLTHYAGVLQHRAASGAAGGHGYIYGQHIAPHDIAVRELGTGTSRREAAARLGLRFCVVPRLRVAEGIDAVRRRLPHIWFDRKKCAAALRALRNYRKVWRSRENVFAERPLHDWTSHAADALRHAVTGYREPHSAPAAHRKARTAYDIWRRQP